MFDSILPTPVGETHYSWGEKMAKEKTFVLTLRADQILALEGLRDRLDDQIAYHNAAEGAQYDREQVMARRLTAECWTLNEVLSAARRASDAANG